MPVLQPAEYDASYFDGDAQALRHNAGYGRYQRWRRNDATKGSTGEYWSDLAARIAQSHSLTNKTVLEIGCAKGFIVKDLRDLGIDAFGLDVSAYAISQCEPEAAPFLTQGDARTALSTYRRNEFDVVFSLRVLECFADADLPGLVSEMSRISQAQFHVVDDVAERLNTTYYNLKSLAQWRDQFAWPNRTRIISHVDEANEVIK